MPETFINWGLIKRPSNWIIVVLMLIIAGMALDLLLHWVNPQQ
jgi:hypothetical protein